MTEELQRAREAYASEIRERAGLRSASLTRAFATVHREDYLGPGPWRIFTIERSASRSASGSSDNSASGSIR